MKIQAWKAGLLSLMASGLMSAQAQQVPSVQDRQAALVGTWKLVSVDTRMAGGSHASFGQNPEGYLIYGSDGMMSVTMQWAGRKPFAAASAREASEAEKASVSDLFSGYAGRYEVLADSTVLHHIEVSSYPNWIGVQQPRIYEINGDQLTLRNKQPIAGSVSYLVWRRVK